MAMDEFDYRLGKSRRSMIEMAVREEKRRAIVERALKIRALIRKELLKDRERRGMA